MLENAVEIKSKKKKRKLVSVAAEIYFLSLRLTHKGIH